jgi:DNA-binding NtrC family response regulator
MNKELIGVLLVEDNAGDARLLQEALWDSPGAASFKLTHVMTLAEAKQSIEEGSCDLMLLDLSLPDSTGLKTLLSALEFAKDTAIVVLTGMNNDETAIEAVRKGAQDYLVKGQVNANTLSRSLHYAMERKRLLQDRERLIAELQEALSTVKKLSGLLPICSSCKKIRDDRGYWTQVEQYIHDHSEAEFTHGICPECMHRLYPGVFPEVQDVEAKTPEPRATPAPSPGSKKPKP